MSRGARIVLGIAMILIAGGFLALVPYMKEVSPQAVPVAVICGVFTSLIAVACFSTASHPVVIRIIAGTIFLLSLFYVFTQVYSFSSVEAGMAGAKVRSRPSIFNTICFLVVFGLPSGFAALKGRYPGWGRHAAAFGQTTSRESEA